MLVGVEVGVHVFVAVGVFVAVYVAVAVFVLVAVGVAVGVLVGDAVLVNVGTGVGLTKGVRVAVAEGVKVGVGCGLHALSLKLSPQSARSSTTIGFKFDTVKLSSITSFPSGLTARGDRTLSGYPLILLLIF